MSTIAKAATDLEAALKTLPTIAVHRDPGAPLANLPAAVIGPPQLTWQAGCIGPTGARFLVYVIVDADERAVERLWELVAQVGDVVDEQTVAVVIQADPAVYVSGTSQLPCYEITVEVGL